MSKAYPIGMAVSDIVRTERVLKALANRRRLTIVRFLKKRRDASVGEIAEEIKLSFKATSKHLGVLAGADIVDREQRSLNMFYSLSSDLPLPARALISVL
jgi:DNA-binding transcriptional ArsR family regulator